MYLELFDKNTKTYEQFDLNFNFLSISTDLDSDIWQITTNIALTAIGSLGFLP